jgi:hypothetical protein
MPHCARMMVTYVVWVEHEGCWYDLTLSAMSNIVVLIHHNFYNMTHIFQLRFSNHTFAFKYPRRQAAPAQVDL